MINQKKAFRRKERKNSALRRGPNIIVKEFLVACEELKEKVPSVDAFYMELGDLTKKLDQEMKLLDPEVNLRVMWFKEAEAENLDDLRVDGVEISWSKFYLRKHPFIDTTKIVDFGYLFVHGYFN
jgi:hypothetical protein